MTDFSAGVLGILIGFSIDRYIEREKNERNKKKLLRDLHDELEETKRKVFPQTTSVPMLYPEVWDSAILSGQIRLLDSEQVTKLTSLFRFIKGTQYEAEWIRRAIEEFNSVTETDTERKKWLENRYKELWSRHFPRGKQLSEWIEEILKEEWWNC